MSGAFKYFAHLQVHYIQWLHVSTLERKLLTSDRHDNRFKVEDDASGIKSFQRDIVTAWACIRLNRLQAGYRFIDLYDMQGNQTEGKLFVLIQKRLR